MDEKKAAKAAKVVKAVRPAEVVKGASVAEKCEGDNGGCGSEGGEVAAASKGDDGGEGGWLVSGDDTEKGGGGLDFQQLPLTTPLSSLLVCSARVRVMLMVRMLVVEVVELTVVARLDSRWGGAAAASGPTWYPWHLPRRWESGKTGRGWAEATYSIYPLTVTVALWPLASWGRDSGVAGQPCCPYHPKNGGREPRVKGVVSASQLEERYSHHEG
jgi:hypothetical protein